MKNVIVVLWAGMLLTLNGCVSVNYLEKKTQEAYQIGFQSGSYQLKECQDAVGRLQQYIQQNQSRVQPKQK